MEVCTEVAECLELAPEAVFWFERGTRQPVVVVWMSGWTPAQVKRRMDLKSSIKEIASRHGAKIYMTPMDPEKREKWEHKKALGRRKYYATKSQSWMPAKLSRKAPRMNC